MKYQLTTPIFWFCARMSLICTCCTWTWGSHGNVIKTYGHLLDTLVKDPYTCSRNRGGYKFRRAMCLIWEPTLFFSLGYQWQEVMNYYSCGGSIGPLRWKTIGTQVFLKSSFSMSFTQLGRASSSPNPWKVNYTDVVAPPRVCDDFARWPMSSTRISKTQSHLCSPLSARFGCHCERRMMISQDLLNKASFCCGLTNKCSSAQCSGANVSLCTNRRN